MSGHLYGHPRVPKGLEVNDDMGMPVDRPLMGFDVANDSIHKRERCHTLARRPGSRSCRARGTMGCSRASTVAQSVRHAVAIAMSMIAAAAWWSNRGRGDTQQIVVRFPVRQSWPCR
jgi:hypothetical protein